MSNKLFVGGLSYSTSETELETLFGQHGNVISAAIIMDRDSGRSKGFGFVEMSSQAEATSAVSGLNGKDVGGRQIAVSEARERAPRKTSNEGSRW